MKFLKILPVYKLKLKTHVYKCLSMPTILYPRPFSELFISNTAYQSYNTSNKQNLRPKVSKRAYMYKNFSFIKELIWNDVKSTSMSPCHLAHLKSQHEHVICITTLSIL